MVVGRAVRRARGLPPALARVPFGVLRPIDAEGVDAHPRPEFRRLVDGGVLHRVATGYYAVAPMSAYDRSWLPCLEAAAFGIAAADYGPGVVTLMG